MIDPSTIRIDEFLLRWYGPKHSDEFHMPTAGLWLPEPLRNWYAITSRLAEPRGLVRRILHPEEIREKDGKAIFMTDATGDWRWSFDVEEPDVVYDGEIHEDWHRNEESLGQLLMHHAIQGAIRGARHLYWNTHVPENLLAGVLTGLEQVAFPTWRWPVEDDYRHFMGDLIIAEVVPDFGPPGHYQVYAASPDRRRLSYLEQLDDIEWNKAGE